MIKKWIEKVYGEQTSLREKIFSVILLIAILTSVFSFVFVFLRGDSKLVKPIFLAVLILLFALWRVVTLHEIDFPAVLVNIAIHLVLLPIAFFTNGGIEGGATSWFIIGLIYVFVLFEGKLLLSMLSVTVLTFLVVCGFAYLHPNWVTPLAGRNNVYTDTIIAVLMVGTIAGILIRFQSKIYEQERKISEKQKEEIEQISLSKSAFFANMSHEIRTPINTIIGLNEMTLRENISDEIAENSVNIQNASKMLLALINDILDWSKIESGRMEIVQRQYETGAMFSDLVNIIWIRAHEKNLEFKIDIAEDIPSMLYGDEVRIKQVLTNILTNAVKYTKKGSVTLSAQSEHIAPNMVRLKISVADTGMGIRKESMDDLFRSFKRVDEESNRHIEGTGLGLTISKQLLDMMGGKITVDSIYTKGSVFTVTLDQKIIDESPVGSMDYVLKRKSFNREKYKQSFEAPDAKVLIVDDNEMNRMVASKLLRATKVQVDTAESGKECLELAKNKYYNVIFMDHMMPEMDGIETLQKLRHQEDGLCQKTPVIALTANAMGGAEQLYQEKGFQGYLAKPINGALFEAMLVKYLPDDLIEYSVDAEELAEERKTIQLISGAKKKAISITTDCVCDLPKEWLEKFDIKSMYYYVYTDAGRFCDIKEIDSDNLLRYISVEGNTAHSSHASVVEYEKFFGDALEEAEEVIHISMASNSSQGYATALSAAKGFGNVTVIDSGHLSSGMGIMVMYAAQMVQDGKHVDEICDKMASLKDLISTSFIVPSPETLYRNQKIGKGVRNICEALELHPVLCLRQSKIICGFMEMGRTQKAYQKYIRHEMLKKKKIDTSLLFITYAGCSVKMLQEIEKEVEKYVKFDRVVFQKASATISSNCGLGAFGLLYMKKKK